MAELANPDGIGGTAVDIAKYKQIEQQYQLLFDRNPNPMWICDIDTLEFLEVNDAALVHYGYSRSEFLAMKVLDLQAPENRAKVLLSASAQKSNPGYSQCLEVRHRKKDGTIIDVEIDSHSLTWLGRSARCVLAKDISDRRAAEFALQHANAELESKVMQRTAELLAVNQQLVAEIVEKQCATDKIDLQVERLDRMYSLVAVLNQATQIDEIYEIAILGIKDLLKIERVALMMPDSDGIPRYQASVGLSETYKQTVVDYLVLHHDRQDPEAFIPKFEESWEINLLDALNTMGAREGIKATAFIPIKYKDRQIGKIVIYGDTPHQFEEEEMRLAQTLAHYVSVSITRKQAELALQVSESRFRTLVDNLPGAIYRCMADENWTTLFLSDAVEAITGRPPSSFSSRRDCTQHIHPEEREKFNKVVESALAAKQPFELDYRLLDTNGKIKWVYEKGQGFWDELGNLLYLDGVIFDISDRKASETKIQQSLQEKEVLLKEVHHRVKNNLQIVSGLLMLRARGTHDRNIAALFEDCQNRIHSMALIHEKLYLSSDLSRIDFKTYLHDLVHSLFQSYNVDFKRIRFQVEIEALYLSIESATPCGLIVNELIVNSLKHAFPDCGEGEIKLTCYKDGEDRVCLTIADTGIGIPEDIDIRKTKSLGLQLVYSLTKQIEGTVELVRSEGTVFQLRFQELENRRRF